MAQQLQNITISAPGFFGLNTQDSPIGLDPSFAAVADNCVIDQLGRIGARKGYQYSTTNGASLLGSSRGIETLHQFIDYSGDRRLLSAGNLKVFVGDTTLVDYTPAGYLATANNWKCVTLANHVYMVQSGHEPLIGTNEAAPFTLERISLHSHSTGVMPHGNEALAAFGRLWVADVVGNKHTVYWSDLLDGSHWTGGSSGSLDLTNVWPEGFDEIVALAAHNGFLIIFGKKSILTYSGAKSPSTMTLADTVAGVGCVSRDSVQHTGTDLIFLSNTGVRTLGRTIQEKSLPMRDISKNVRNDLVSLIQQQNNPIKSLYSQEEAFYLLSFPDSGIIYCFDMRVPLENDSHRVTTWSGMGVNVFTRCDDGTIHMGVSDGIVKYSGYLDDTEQYQLRYFSNPLDFQSPANLKFLKKFNLTIIGGQSTPTTLNWGYDYTSDYTKQPFIFGSTNLAEYGISEYNTTAEYSAAVVINTPKVNASGNGSVVTVGIEAQINNSAFSIQKIDIHALLGRLI